MKVRKVKQMGYYTQYLSTIFKGPWATTLKERLGARRALKNLGSADKSIYKILPEKVEKEHRVTFASKEENKVIKKLKVAAAKGYMLAFNLSTMDLAVLEAINKLMDVWSKLRALTSRGGAVSKRVEQISQLIVSYMFNAIKKAEGEEREEYKDIMVIVDESPSKTHEQFMQMVRLRFQSLESQSFLTRLAVRGEIKGEKRALDAIKKLTAQCESLLAAANSKKGTKADQTLNVINKFEALAKESAADIERVFYEAHQIKKRDFLLMMKLLVNLEALRGMNRKWLQMHFMPEVPIRKKEIEIDKLEEKISKEFHTVAQALRISINGLEKLETKIKKLA